MPTQHTSTLTLLLLTTTLPSHDSENAVTVAPGHSHFCCSCASLVPATREGAQYTAARRFAYVRPSYCTTAPTRTVLRERPCEVVALCLNSGCICICPGTV